MNTFGPYLCYSDEEAGNIQILRRCPCCNRFIKEGKVFVNGQGYTRTEGWVCKKCGEVKPLIEYF